MTLHTPFPSHKSWPQVRAEIEDHIERLIAVLDEIDPDPDLEPWLGSGDDREDENEHGGDTVDEPHDQADEGDDEPSLGRLETIEQTRGSYSGSEAGVPDRNARAQRIAPAAVERPDDAIGFLRIVPLRRG